MSTENEKKIVRHMLETMRTSGWMCSGVDDGGDLLREPNDDDAIDHAFAVEEAVIYFKNADTGKRHHVVLIFGNGNEGIDVIADHSMGGENNPDDFLGLMDAVQDFADLLGETPQINIEDISTLEQESRQMRARMERLEKENQAMLQALHHVRPIIVMPGGRAMGEFAGALIVVDAALAEAAGA